ncbi:MAG: hypothetical protein ACLTCI_13005 [[Clostridium] nexile]
MKKSLIVSWDICFVKKSISEGTSWIQKIVEKLGLTKKSIESIGYITTDKKGFQFTPIAMQKEKKF